MMKKLFAAVLVLMLAVTGLAMAEDNSLQNILDKKTFVLGLDDSFPPMGYRDDNNDIVGFDIDTAKAVCEKLGVELVLQPISWDAKELELSSGNIDCIWNGMSITPEREESMAMSFAYLNNQMVFYTKADAAVASAADLAGKKIAVQNGSYAEEILADEANAELTASFDEVLGYDDYLTALMDLQQGGVDAVFMDLVVGDFRINGMGATDLKAAFSFEDDNYGIGFRKDDIALRDKVQEILVEMKKDGTLAAISESWFGSDITVVPAE
ncbi:MAG: amino acid ABC transporter substrate-binding protein [Eubacteriales bacterium]|nr:amino acid ABC transporter substrate-binding protein [Eubacteriales bacterium]